MEIFIGFMILLSYSLEIIPNWNLNSSAVNLLPTSGSVTYTVVDRDMYAMKVKLIKTITKSGETITITNSLSINEGISFNVDFDNIESFYHLNGIDIVCPKGKYHPYDATNKKYLQPTNFEIKGNWDLKCYKHNTNYFLAFYLMNGDKHLYYSKSQYDAMDFSWKTKSFTSQLFDFKLDNGDVYKEGSAWKNYDMGAIILDSHYLKLKSLMAQFHNHDQNDDLVYIFDSQTADPLTIDLMEAKKYSQAFFNNYSDEFYFYTYDNISDFTSGYSTVTTSNYGDIGNVQININTETPFEFVDEAQIIEMNFLLYNKYIYYTINNTKTGEIYHGLYDVKLGKIMFNTNEYIKTFIPYSPNSMLAITENNVYKICALKDGDNCIEDCSSNQVIRDSDGNKCGSICDNDKYLLIPDNVCMTQCDTTIYMTNTEKHCGLCKDMDSSKPYKLIGSTECLSNIPNNTEVYNSKLYLLNCKSGYILDRNDCIPHCFITCQTCSDYSEDEENQKCLTCNESYYLENEKCIKIIPTTIPTTLLTTIPSTISTTIPTTIVTTIPSTIPTIIFSTIITTIPTTLPSTVLSKIPTTIPSTEITTILKTTIPFIECLHEKCLSCNEESNRLGLCLSCNEGYKKVNYTSVFPQFLDCMKKEDPKLKSFYFNETSNEFRPCYKKCEKCEIGGDDDANYCLECKNGYMFRPGDNPKNNCVVYSDFYYISPYGQYKVLDVLQCPEEAKFIIKDKNFCIDDCKKDHEYKYLYNGICLKNCPEGTINEDYLCIENKDECKLVENDIYLKEKEDFQIIKTLAKTYLDEFNYTDNHISLYRNNDYSIILYKNRDCLDKVSLSMPKIDFKECYNKVKKEYNINDHLLISIVDQKGSKGASSIFNFFHPLSGEELNYIEICQDEEVTIKENVTSILNNENNTNFELQISLIEQGIDIFDLDNPFYKDLCFDFDNKEKRDIPLSMRIEKAFPNVLLCEQGCKANGIQLPEKVAICDCSLNNLVNKDFIKDNALLESTLGKALDLINSSNIMVVTCYKYIFKYFTRSIGGLISFILIVIHIISTILYFLWGSPKLKIYILSLTDSYLNFLNKKKLNFENAPPRKKTIKNDILANQMNKSNKKVKINQIIIKKEGVNKKSISKRLNTGNVIKNKYKEKSSIGRPLLTSTKLRLTNQNDITFSLKESKGYRSRLALLKDKKFQKNQELEQPRHINESKNKKFFEDYLGTNPDDMELDDALVKDKRKYSEYLIENLKEKQTLVFTFFSDDPVKIRIMRIILFILNINLYFVITGLFYSEQYITELYKINEKTENFFSYIPRSIDKLIYTTLVNIIIGYIIELFFPDEKIIKKIFRREKDNTIILKEKIINLTKSIVKMYIAFIIFAFIILLISFYYLLCFNYVYPKTQVEWLKCSITIIIVMQLLSVLRCILQTSLRYLSFKLNSSKIYKISKLLN